MERGAAAHQIVQSTAMFCGFTSVNPQKSHLELKKIEADTRQFLLI